MPEGAIDLVDLGTLRPIRTLRGHVHEVISLAYSHDGTRLASVGPDGVTRLWDPLTGHELLSLASESWTWDVALSRDNRRMVTANGDGSFSVWGDVGKQDDPETEREAQSVVRFLFATPLLRHQVTARLQADCTISEAARGRAFAIAAVYPEDVRKLYRESWAVVRDPRATAASARAAVLQAEAACRVGADRRHFQVCLALARYRAGDFAGALRTITDFEGVKASHPSEPEPIGMAVRCMSLFRLGDRPAAEQAFNQLAMRLQTQPARLSRLGRVGRRRRRDLQGGRVARRPGARRHGVIAIVIKKCCSSLPSAGTRFAGCQTASLFEVKWKSWARIAGTVSAKNSLPAGDGDAGCFEVLQQIDRALVEPEVVDRVNDLAVFDQPDAVAGEAGDHRVLRVDRADVPEPRDEQGARGLGDQGFERLVRAFQDQAAGERDRLDVGFLGPVAVDGERFHDAVFDPGGLAGRQPARAATATAAACRHRRRQGVPGLRGLNGSERSVTPSAKSFSPRRVPPPGFDKKLRPSSAVRAFSEKSRNISRSATASGSRMTV